MSLQSLSELICLYSEGQPPADLACYLYHAIVHLAFLFGQRRVACIVILENRGKPPKYPPMSELGLNQLGFLFFADIVASNVISDPTQFNTH